MSLIEEKLTEQFYAWELRGRGWQIWDVPVAPEPPFRPFYGHFLTQEPAIDDGRRPTFLSSFVDRLSELGAKVEPEPVPQEEDEPDPEILARGTLIELQASLPPTLQISKETFDQFISSLGYCQEPITFELLGTHEAITAQIVAGEQDVNRVEHQLESHFPDAVFTKQSGVLEQKWHEHEDTETVMVQFGLSREFMLPLATARNFNIDPFIGLTGALSDLEAGELGLFQVTFQPVRHPWGESILRSVTDGEGGDFFVNAPELAKEAKTKISRPLYAVVLRIAVKSDARAWDIARNLAGALRVFSNPHGNELIPLENTNYSADDQEEDVLRRQSRRCGMILNSDELISLVHLPSSSVRAPKLKREAQKSKAPPKIISNPQGVLLGENVHAGKLNEVRLSGEQRVRHMHCIGASGTGKSTFLLNLIRQDIENGQGLAVLDPHGDLIDTILGSIPEHRIEDVIVVDPSDEEFSVGFNILSAHSDLEKNLLASDLVSVFQRLSTSWGDQMGSVLNNAILAFLESSQGGTLADLRRFLIEPDFRKNFLKTVEDPEVIYYWTKGFPLLSGNKSVGPILTRLETFLSPKPIRYMVSQKENRLDFSAIMNSGKILLLKLSQGKLGKENSYLLGSLFVAKFHQTAMSRQNLPEAARRDFWLYMDEFHNFITPSMAEILSGARKYRVGLVLAHQELRQLQRDSEVASAVLSNPYTRVCFRVGDQDAKALENGFSFFEARDLQNLGIGEAICRVERSDFDFNLSVPLLPAPSETEAAETRRAVITASRRKYAVSRQEIEDALREASAATLTEIEPAKPKHTKPVADVTKPAVSEPATIAQPEPAPEPVSQAESKAEPVASTSIVSQPEPAEAEPRQPAFRDKGIGGHQHNLIRERIEMVARQLGYTASREHRAGEKQKVDLVLEKANRSIACEIAITTTIDHEVGNVGKCLKAGYPTVAVVSPSEDRLEKIRQAVLSCLPVEETARVIFHTPDQFISHLQELAIQDTSAVTAPKKSETTYGKYKVKTTHVQLTAEERKQREEAMFQTLSAAMKKPR